MTTAPPPAAPPPTPPPPMDPPMWQPPPPPPGPPVRPQLRRSRTDKILGGVSGGLAEYSGIDALLWRVGFVALALAGGTGVVVYLLLWLLMPAGPPGYGLPAEQQAVKAPPAPRSPVPGLTIAALLIVMGVMAMITRIGGWDLGPRAFIGSALLVVGLGLVAAAFSGGRTARGGLIALGIVLSVALVTASTLPWNGVRGGVGDRTFRPAADTQVRDVYRNGVGDMTVDLSGVDVSDLDRPITTRIEHGVGDVDITVPHDADVRLSIESGLGSIDAFDQGSVSHGFFPGSGSGSWVDDGRAEITIVVHSGVGDVEVSRD